MSLQLNIFQAEQARDEGIARAADHAEETFPGWKQKAMDLVKDFLLYQHGEFMAEDIRAYGEKIDFPSPPHQRAWGHVIKEAARAGIIERIRFGQVKNIKAHRANASVWRKA